MGPAESQPQFSPLAAAGHGPHTRMNQHPGAARALFLATVSFALAFSAWGLLSGLLPVLKDSLALTGTQASLLVAAPVLLGGLARLPAGFLCDRYGPRAVMVVLLLCAAVPGLALAAHVSYASLLGWGTLLGLAGAAFVVGAAYTSPWFPREKQGLALGLFGLGNAGKSLGSWLGPLLAQQHGPALPFLLFGGVMAAWALVFLGLSAPPPGRKEPMPLRQALAPLRVPQCWLFGLFYAATLGAIVALGVYLPTLLKETFHLVPTTAGGGAAAFVLLATSARPLGGFLADRVGGGRVLAWAYAGAAVLAPALAAPDLALFTGAAAGLGICLGLGSGAVFKLVPTYFPDSVGTVSGLVGAAGGLGGFFPPMLLGLLHDTMGTYAPGFAAGGLVAAACLLLVRRELRGELKSA